MGAKVEEKQYAEEQGLRASVEGEWHAIQGLEWKGCVGAM